MLSLFLPRLVFKPLSWRCVERRRPSCVHLPFLQRGSVVGVFRRHRVSSLVIPVVENPIPDLAELNVCAQSRHWDRAR